MLPTEEFKVEGDMLIKSDSGPIVELLLNEPNPEQTPYTFKKWMQNNICMHGNGYAQIVRNKRTGVPEQLWPLRADRVELDRLEDGTLIYKYNSEDGKQVVIFSENMLHIKGFHSTGLVGMSLIKIGEQSIGSAVAKAQYTNSFFKNGAVPDYALMHPGKLDTQAQANLRREWEKQYGGSENAHKIGILVEGSDIKQIGISPEASQLVESATFSVQEVARVFNMPPHRLMDLSNAALANIAQQGVEYITYTIGPWQTNWSQQLEHDLYPKETRRQYRIVFDNTHFMMADPKQMTETLGMQVQKSLRTPNEARKILNLNPRDDGDALIAQLAMTTMERILAEAEAAMEALKNPEPEPTEDVEEIVVEDPEDEDTTETEVDDEET
jgi:HK97 family phage portal protein